MSKRGYERVLPETVILPEESFGSCKRYLLSKIANRRRSICPSKGISSILADGLCEHCWDKMVSNKAIDNKNDNIYPRSKEDINSLEKSYSLIFDNQN